jgi:hypothetical protein
MLSRLGALRVPGAPPMPVETALPSVNARLGSWQEAQLTEPSRLSAESLKSLRPSSMRIAGAGSARDKAGRPSKGLLSDRAGCAGAGQLIAHASAAANNAAPSLSRLTWDPHPRLPISEGNFLIASPPASFSCAAA